MVADQLSVTFSALADPTRRAILARLASGERNVGDLAEPFAMTMPAITKHLKVLEKAGLPCGPVPNPEPRPAGPSRTATIPAACRQDKSGLREFPPGDGRTQGDERSSGNETVACASSDTPFGK